MENRTIARTMFMTAAALAGCFALVLQLYLTIDLSHDKGQSFAEGVIRYFSYFTILTNIIVAFSFVAPLLKPTSRYGRFFADPKIISGIAMYICVVGIIYFLVLRNSWNPEGWQLVANVIFHYAIPMAYVVYWLAFVPKGSLVWKDAIAWLIYPIVYTPLVLFHGAVSGQYPYSFLDVDGLGYPRVLANMATLLVVFLVIGLLLVMIDRLMSRSVRAVRG